MNIFSKEMLFASGDSKKVFIPPNTRPNLTSSGTLGGDEFAVSAGDNAEDAYKAVDSRTSTYYTSSTSTASMPVWYYIYNPKPLNITQIKMTFKSSYPGTLKKVVGSKNNSKYTEIDMGYDSSSGALILNHNQYYKYYGLSILKKNFRLIDIRITATEQG